jgi:hypothetical protein
LPSEFKQNWENLGKDFILEAFENTFDDPKILSHLVQDSIKVIYEEANKTIKNKILNILKSLNIEEVYNDKFLIRFRLLFQEYFSIIFVCSVSNFENVKAEMLKIVEKYSYDNKSIIIDDINSKGFSLFIQNSFKLCIYMLLHDPQLLFNISEYEKRKLVYNFYNKNDFLNIDGFGKEQTPCLMILPPPLLRSNFAYQGLKPAVYMIVNSNEDIIADCIKNKEPAKQRSLSSSDLNILQDEDRKSNLT